MANNTKTPVMVLQELTVKRGWSTPEYTLTFSKQGTHENIFHYQLNIRGFEATGCGSSKQRAKHNVASQMLKILKEHGLYHESVGTVIIAPKQTEKEPSSYNVVSVLREKCFEHKLPQPFFDEISGVGPPHCREFTYECKLASLATRGIAGTKKQAKQVAAQEMLEKLEDLLPSLMEQCNTDSSKDVKSITETDNLAMEMFKQIRPCSRPKPNLGMKIANYDCAFANILDKKDLTFDDIKGTLNENNPIESLENFLKKIDLDFGILEIVSSPNNVIVVLSISIDIPFSVFGEGKTEEQASYAAASKAIEYLKYLLA